MVRASRAAGDGLMRHFRALSRLEVELKGPSDFVSAADLEAEATLRSALLGAFPTYGFVAEESAAMSGTDSSARFIVDPLDGTTNFLRGIGHFAVSVGLERDGRMVAGVVFDPARDEMFVAEEGGGAWLGDERMRVSADADPSLVLVATGIPHANRPERHEAYLPKLAAAMRVAAGIRRFGAASLDLAYVAAGRFAVFFEYGLAPWDVAAGTLLVREAGGRVSEPAGGDRVVASGDVLATNGRLHDEMMALLAGRG